MKFVKFHQFPLATNEKGEKEKKMLSCKEKFWCVPIENDGDH